MKNNDVEEGSSWPRQNTQGPTVHRDGVNEHQGIELQTRSSLSGNQGTNIHNNRRSQLYKSTSIPDAQDDGEPASPYQAMPFMEIKTDDSDQKSQEGPNSARGTLSQSATLKSQDSIQFEKYDALRDRTAAAKNAESYGMGCAGSVAAGSARSLGTFSITLGSKKQELLHRLQHEIQFSSPKEVENSSVSTFNHKKAVVSMYMACLAIIGCLMRICIAQYFGEECKNPGTVGWLAASSPLCVTANGEATQSGGIVFADLPSNMLGCFIIGVLQTSAALKLTTHTPPLAFLSTDSVFQTWDIMILAVRTGFCGSLTTFSSWNSAMVVMMYGTGAPGMNQWAQALFGYIIGLETAYGSFVMGKKIAVYLHREMNPKLKDEADKLEDSGNGILGNASDQQHRHVHVNKMIPDFERRFLIGIIGEDEINESQIDRHLLRYLEKWRISTYDQRSDVYIAPEALTALNEIERVLLVLNQEPSDVLKVIAKQYGWSVKALKVWTKYRIDTKQSMEVNSWAQKYCFLFKLPVATSILIFLFIIPLVAGIVLGDVETAYGLTYRTMWYSALWAPFGALLRWKLSDWNGSLSGDWKWLPLGTLSANFIGSVVSVLMIALEYRTEDHGLYWRGCTYRAIKIGFAGCLTTVSTFIAEVDTLNQGFPRYNWDWMYISLSLGGSFVLAMTIYGIVAYAS